MKHLISHITRLLLLSGALLALCAPASAQTPGGTQIVNTASATFRYLSGQTDSVKSDPAIITVEAWGNLFLNKTASRVSAANGDTVLFTIKASYTGTLGASQVVVTDTVPALFRIISVTRGTVNGNILTWNAGRVTSSTPDSMIVTVVVRDTTTGTYSVTNTATATDSIGTVLRSSATVTLNIVKLESCRISIRSSSGKILANGQQYAVIIAHLTDSLGVPKPDGTPVHFSATLGTFSNGKDTVTKYVNGGYAVDSLNADIVSADYLYSTVTVRLMSICNVEDTVGVEFYPGAITGTVLDNITKTYYKNAYVRLVDSVSGKQIDTAVTRTDGKFFMFVPKTAVYRVDVSAADKFALENTVSTYVKVDIRGTATNVIPNKNSISGTVYYWISNRPIYIPNMPIELYDLANGDDRSVKGEEARGLSHFVYSSTTDDRGVYKFEDIKPGKYRVVLGASELNGTATITIPEQGYYVLNGNIPVELTRVPTIVKSGTPTAILGDTLVYDIAVRNPNKFAVTDVTVKDSLPSELSFISASHSGTFDAPTSTVTWKLGNVDSTYNGIVTLRTKLRNTSSNGVVNTAVLTTAETLPANDTAGTVISRTNALTVRKTANRDSAQVGDTIQYRIVVRNAGNTPLASVTMRDTIDAQKLQVILVSPNATLQNNVVTMTQDTLFKGDSVIINVRVRVIEASSSGYLNRAYASSAVTPFQNASVIVPQQLSIAPNTALLSLVKTVSRDTVVNGDTLRYVLRFRNTGTKNLTNVVVTDTLPAQVTKNTVLYGNGTIDKNILTFFAGPLAIGEEDSVVIVSVAAGSPYKPERVTNVGYAKANETALQRSEASFTALIGRLDKLVLEKRASASNVQTGDSLSYLIRLTNVSNRKITHVVVKDPIPFQLEHITVAHTAASRTAPAKISVVPFRSSGLVATDSLQLDGSVVIYMKDTMDVGEVDSFMVRTTVRTDRPNYEAILNTATGTSDQTAAVIAQAVTIVQPKVPHNFKMELTKHVSKDTVHIGDTLSYVLRFRNTSAVTLTNVQLSDTLPAYILKASVSNNAAINGNIITYSRASLAPGASDSIVVKGQLDPYTVHDGEYVINFAFAHADQSDEQTAYAIFTAKTDPACRIIMTAVPDKIIGNGRSKAFIQVHLTNTLGYPKPDGTPVLLTTTVGEFSNGQASRVLYSKDGLVSDSLKATVAGNKIVNAMAIAAADDGKGCKAKDTIDVVFYPGAIEGYVIDHRTQLPVEGAKVEAYQMSNDSLIGSLFTKADGYYLFPVAKSDSFRVIITTKNEFDHDVVVRSIVRVNVSGQGDAPTPNVNSVSGAVYYLVSHQPIGAAHIGVRLQMVNPTPKMDKYRSGDKLIAIDSVYTDSTGTFTFEQIPAGDFELSLIHPSVQGSLKFRNNGNGTYLINANIAVTLNPNIVFAKSGPSRVSLNDTATYRITMKNTGTLSTTNTVVVDSLHWAMKFVSATGGGVYLPATHTVRWNLGTFDSLASKSVDVKVRFVDTLVNSTPTLNRAVITSNQTTPIRDSVPTLAFLPPTMRVWKVANIHQANPGDTVIYTMKVKNQSGSASDSITVKDPLPSQVQFLSASADYYHGAPASLTVDSVSYDGVAHTATWKRDTLFVGDSATITIVTRVRRDLEPGDHTYTNIASLNWKGGTTPSDLDSASDATVRSFVAYLQVTKTALRKVLEIGDVATYLITVKNTSPTSYARDIQVLDRIPFGFSYIKGSTFADSVRIADPTGRKELLWLLKDSLGAGKSMQFVYRLVAGAGAADGNGINTAQAFGVSQHGSRLVSAEVQERVEVRRGVFSTHGLIIGKVFYDDNRNRYQDSGEVGVKRVELMMEDGTRIVTGDDGKYSIPDVLPGEHVIRVRTHTLPKDATLEMGYNDFAKDSTSRFVQLTESGIARVDFYLARNESRPDSLQLDQSIAKVGDLSIQRIVSPRNLVFIEDKRFASMKLTGLNFEVGKAILKPESFVTLKQLADILREYPDQPLIIAGHTDSMKIATAEFPNNKILSMARAMAVKNFLVEKEGINVDRIRIEGHGETRPVATNKTIDGRALNRRVEFFFTPSTEDKPVTEMPVAVEIPIEYTGSENVSKVDFRDILDPSFTYVEGSATFADSAIRPVINGNELHWTLTNLGPNFRAKLRYSVMVSRPANYEATTHRSSTASICYFVGDSVVKCMDTVSTMNEVAVAVRGRAVNFVMSGVLFDVAKATLRSAAMSALETTAKSLKEDPSATAVIEGHTDSSPIHTREFPSNLELSQARAMTIKQALVSNYGIDASRLKTIGYGEFRPLASNLTKEGRQVNRRIEMRITRSEFSQRVIAEGGVDSSRQLTETLLPKNAPATMDSIVRDKSKERYILTITVRRVVKRNTAVTTVMDTIPAGLNLVARSITRVRGVDSVTVNGNVLLIHAAAKDSTMQLYYMAEVDGSRTDEATVSHDYTVRKKQSDGSVVEQRSAPVSVEIRKKRTMVRRQR